MNNTIRKEEIIKRICAKTGLAFIDASQVVQLFMDEIVETLGAGDRMEFRNFGVFEPVMQKARPGRNPKVANSQFIIPPRMRVRFIMGKEMKAKVEKLKIS